MAQQTGILGIQGTVGGLVFAKDGSIRQKPASNKASFQAKDSMARVRENASEFGGAATASKLVRDSLRVAIQAASDKRMVSRLTQAMRAAIALDGVHDRGMRQVLKSNLAPLLGFNFNLGAGIGQNLFFQYTLTGNGQGVTLAIPSLNPQTDIAAPTGATHYEIVVGASSVNFLGKTYQQAAVAAPLGILPLNGAALTNRTVVATLPAAPGADDLVVGVLGVNYYQQLNGKYYPLNNNASNPLAVEYVNVVASAVPAGGGSATSYDTTLTGPNQDAQGVTLAASAGDTFGFNALATGGSAPASMDVSVGGAQVASVAYLDRYAGQAFTFTHNGAAHTGAFAATVNF
ncbi:hypothetical protein ACFQ48_14305 [Hymenobacter caeli]|uniref:Uncharacterized protein n=1 Tax=Hymenobacter caeli TaxID=2735894 RepID=A0ABX2FSD8_9BACT|nr:hypothetical protein [Hymenobacter caeli]NRT20093.1 hypothetical protein [Hymenobacter caeli]